MLNRNTGSSKPSIKRRRGARSASSVSSADLVESSELFGNDYFGLLIQPKAEGISLKEWTRHNQEYIDK